MLGSARNIIVHHLDRYVINSLIITLSIDRMKEHKKGKWSPSIRYTLVEPQLNSNCCFNVLIGIFWIWCIHSISPFFSVSSFYRLTHVNIFYNLAWMWWCYIWHFNYLFLCPILMAEVDFTFVKTWTTITNKSQF